MSSLAPPLAAEVGKSIASTDLNRADPRLRKAAPRVPVCGLASARSQGCRSLGKKVIQNVPSDSQKHSDFVGLLERSSADQQFSAPSFVTRKGLSVGTSVWPDYPDASLSRPARGPLQPYEAGNCSQQRSRDAAVAAVAADGPLAAAPRASPDAEEASHLPWDMYCLGVF